MQKIQQSNKSYWRVPQSIFTLAQDYTQCYIQSTYEIGIIPQSVGQFQNMLYLADKRQLCCYQIDKQFPLAKYEPQINLINAFNIQNNQMVFLQSTPVILADKQIQLLDIDWQTGNIDVIQSISLGEAVDFFGAVKGTVDSFYIIYNESIQIYIHKEVDKQLYLALSCKIEKKIQILDIGKVTDEQYILAYYADSDQTINVQYIYVDNVYDKENSDDDKQKRHQILSKKLFTDNLDVLLYNSSHIISQVCVNHHLENFIVVGTTNGDIYILYAQLSSNTLEVIEQYSISSCKIVSLSFSPTHPDILLIASSDNQLKLIRCGFKPQILIDLSQDEQSFASQYILLHELADRYQSDEHLINNDFGLQKQNLGYLGKHQNTFTIIQTLHCLFDERNLLSCIQITDKEIKTYTLKLSPLTILWLNNMASCYIKRYLRDIDMKNDNQSQLIQLKVKILEAMYRRDISGALQEVFNEIDNILEQQGSLIQAEQCFQLFEPCMRYLTWVELQDVKEKKHQAIDQKQNKELKQNTLQFAKGNNMPNKKLEEQQNINNYENSNLSMTSLQSLSTQTGQQLEQLQNQSQEPIKQLQQEHLPPKKAGKHIMFQVFQELPITTSKVQCLYPTMTDKSLYQQYYYIIQIKKYIQEDNQVLDKRLYVLCLEYIKRNLFLKTDRLVSVVFEYLQFTNNPTTSAQSFALQLLDIRYSNQQGQKQPNQLTSTTVDTELLNLISICLSPSIFSGKKRGSLLETELFIQFIKTSMNVTMRNIENLDINVLNQTYFRNPNTPHDDQTYQIYHKTILQENVLISENSIESTKLIPKKGQSKKKKTEQKKENPSTKQSTQISPHEDIMSTQHSTTLIDAKVLQNNILLSGEVSTQFTTNKEENSDNLVVNEAENDTIEEFDKYSSKFITYLSRKQEMHMYDSLINENDKGKAKTPGLPLRHQSDEILIQYLKTIDFREYLNFVAQFRAGYLISDNVLLEQLPIEEYVDNFKVQIIDQSTFAIYYTVLLVKKEFSKAALFIEKVRTLCQKVVKQSIEPEYLSLEMNIKASKLYISIFNNYEFYRQLAYLVNVSFWHKLLIYFEEQLLGGAQTVDLVVQQLQIIIDCMQIPFLTANLLINTMSDRVSTDVKNQLLNAKIIDNCDILEHNFIYNKLIIYLNQIRETFVTNDIASDEDLIDQCQTFIVQLHDVFQIVDNLNLEALTQTLRQLITALKGQ